MTDVIHDPETDWCACEPEGDRRCGYRILADKIVEEFNPPDGEESELSICFNAIEDAAAYIASQPCTCTLAMLADWDACPRCRALGRRGDKAVQR